MKTLKFLSIAIGMLLATLSFNSCLDDNDGYSLDNFVLSVASVKTKGGSAPFFRLDNGKTLWPAAGQINASILKDNQRVLLNYTLLGDSTTGAVGFDYYIRINGIDTLLTKPIVENLAAKNDSVYGTDPVRIVNMWTGNGHLTVDFEANFGNKRAHLINLVATDWEKTPYTLEFRQNAFDDPQITRAKGLVCFDLSKLPAQLDKDSILLTIRVNTFDGLKEYAVKYNPTDRSSQGQAIHLNRSVMDWIN